jgi:DUF2950 family protein
MSRTANTHREPGLSSRAHQRALSVWIACALLSVSIACRSTAPESSYRTFATPEEAVRALIEAVKAEKLDEVLAIFGPESQELVATSDPATGRGNRQVFTAAVAEGWQLVDNEQGGKTLVIGNESWPFPVPLVQDAGRWRFDTAAGKEEVIARRIGRNELAAIRISRTYVAAQRQYAEQGHDGKPKGTFAQKVRSDPGKQDGLYWPTQRGQPRSPLGDLVAEAAADGRSPLGNTKPAPFYGYYFRILTGQGADAPGGARSYLVGGEMTGGFALVAWPAEYDATGVMTFLVNQDGTTLEKDLGPETAKLAGEMAVYNPDPSWSTAE